MKHTAWVFDAVLPTIILSYFLVLQEVHISMLPLPLHWPLNLCREVRVMYKCILRWKQSRRFLILCDSFLSLS